MKDLFGGLSIEAVLVALLIFLVIRELLCWYWKMNEVVDLLKKQGAHLASIAEDMRTLTQDIERKVESSPVEDEYDIELKREMAVRDFLKKQGK